MEGPETIEEVSRLILQYICSRISHKQYCDGLKKDYKGPDGASRCMWKFNTMASNVMLETHQNTLDNLQTTIAAGFATAELQSVIDLTSAVNDLNNTLPDSGTNKLRVSNIALASYCQSAAKKHGPIVTAQLETKLEIRGATADLDKTLEIIEEIFGKMDAQKTLPHQHGALLAHGVTVCRWFDAPPCCQSAGEALRVSSEAS